MQLSAQYYKHCFLPQSTGQQTDKKVKVQRGFLYSLHVNMIYDSVLVCHFPRDSFTTLNQQAAKQYLWIFLKEFNVLQISPQERWLEIQCGKSISQKDVEILNQKLQHSVNSAISDYDFIQKCKLYLKVMYEMGRLAEGVAQIINVKDSTMCHGVASELLTNIKRFAGTQLPQQLQLYQSQKNQVCFPLLSMCFLLDAILRYQSIPYTIYCIFYS